MIRAEKPPPKLPFSHAQAQLFFFPVDSAVVNILLLFIAQAFFCTGGLKVKGEAARAAEWRRWPFSLPRRAAVGLRGTFTVTMSGSVSLPHLRTLLKAQPQTAAACPRCGSGPSAPGPLVLTGG